MRLLKWLYPGLKVKRWLVLFAAGVTLVSTGLAIVFNYQYIGVLEELIFRLSYLATGKYNYAIVATVGAGVVGCGFVVMWLAFRMIVRSIVSAVMPGGSDKLIDILLERRKMSRGPAITVIGGGTGLSVLLRGIKTITHNVTAVVTVSDDGGSSGRIIQQLGIVPPGDLRNCLVALADTEPLMEKLFQHRFGGVGDLAGHSFGNLFLAAMTEVVGDVELALKESSKVLAVRGRVLPSTKEKVTLVAELADGRTIRGETNIAAAGGRIARLRQEPMHPTAVASAVEAILQAEVIILGPGSLYTSVLPNLLVPGIAEALGRTKAVKIYICNVMTQPGETDGYSAADHVRTILEHVGPHAVDQVLVNTQEVAEVLCSRYACERAYPVKVDLAELKALGPKVVQANLINETDLVRHDPVKLTKTLISMVHDVLDAPESFRVLDQYLLDEKLKERY